MPKPAGPRVAALRRRLAGVLSLITVTSLALPGLVQAASPPLLPGHQTGAIVVLQAALDDWGQNLPWTGYYGASTTSALQAMQRAAGLPPTGSPDPATLARLGLAPGGPVMHLGSRGPDVRALQRALTRAGYGVEATGLVGLQTDGMIRAFQYQHGQASTGSITLQAVESELATSGREGVVSDAVDQLGAPYVWGGVAPSGFDCSGLVTYTFAQQGVALPHDTYGQWTDGTSVAAGDLQPGDLVFFSTYAAGPSHVGIYVGDGYFVHAENPQRGVTVSSLDSSYWNAHYIGAIDPFVLQARAA